MRNQQVYLTIYSFCAVICKAKIEQCIQKFPERCQLQRWLHQLIIKHFLSCNYRNMKGILCFTWWYIHDNITVSKVYYVASYQVGVPVDNYIICCLGTFCNLRFPLKWKTSCANNFYIGVKRTCQYVSATLCQDSLLHLTKINRV